MGDQTQDHQGTNGRIIIKNDYSMVRFNNDKSGIENQYLFYKIRQDTGPLHNRRKPKPQLHKNANHFLEVTDKYG